MHRTEGAGKATALLREMQAALTAQGIDRLPQRSDFSPEQIVLIKAHLGPWPRALEAAGLKPPRADDRIERQTLRRIEAKRRQTKAKRERQIKYKSKGENDT